MDNYCMLLMHPLLKSGHSGYLLCKIKICQKNSAMLCNRKIFFVKLFIIHNYFLSIFLFNFVNQVHHDIKG